MATKAFLEMSGFTKRFISEKAALNFVPESIKSIESKRNFKE
jgi:hypothetical protein